MFIMVYFYNFLYKLKHTTSILFHNIYLFLPNELIFFKNNEMSYYYNEEKRFLKKF